LPADGGRAAGVLVPLFALRRERERGIGEIGDVPAFCRWLASAGHRLLQLLPIGEMPEGERSPYAASSAFAIDPIYVSLDAVPELAGDDAAVRSAPAAHGVDYDAVRTSKRAALDRAFRRFVATEWQRGSARAAAFGRFRDAEAGWLADYALFRACQERYGRHGRRPWTDWEPGLRDRAPTALADAAATLADERLFHEWVQWIAAEQWAAARAAANALGVRLKGDLPFAVGVDSADVWSRPDEFARDLTLGAPPDAFSPKGQNWGLPVYRWDVMARNGFDWLRGRSARAAALFDAFRIDHVVGFYRQWTVAPDGTGAFLPADEDEQLTLGERLLGVVRAAARGTDVVGEDLGVVPPFVRRSLARLDVPGYRVLRWEADGGRFRDPATWPSRSVATSGTHDTSALATWWTDELDDAGRRALAAVPGFAPLRDADATFTPAVQDALLDGLYAARSELVVVPFPDAYGGRERINVPATVGVANWGYRLPWTLEELDGPAGAELAARLRARAQRRARA
jgi:4-alpha-glucanotransferase